MQLESATLCCMLRGWCGWGALVDKHAGSGDVKYHLGTSYDRPTKVGKTIHLSLLANPSHLEAVNTIVLGKCRARQFYEDDDSRRGTMPILLHGDGAFSGQVRRAPPVATGPCPCPSAASCCRLGCMRRSL